MLAMRFGKLMAYFLLTWGLSGRLVAEPVAIPISDGMPAINETAELNAIIDLDKKLDFRQILAGEHTETFQRIGKDSVRLRGGAHWYQGIFENPTQHDILVYLQFDLSSHLSVGHYSMFNVPLSPFQESGWKMAFKDRAIPFLYPTIEVVFPPGKSKLIMRCEGRSFSFNIGSKAAITRMASIFETIIVGCCATFIALGLFNFFLFTRTRDRGYLYYALRCVFITVLCALAPNYIAKYFLTEVQVDFQKFPPWIAAVNSIIWLFVTQKFLVPEQFIPARFLKGINLFIGAGLGIGVVIQIIIGTSDPCILLKIFSPLSLIYFVSVGVYTCFKGYRPAFFYVPATTIYFAGVMVMLLAVEGVLPASIFTYLAPCCSGVMEALLMSFGLGDKYMMYMKAANAALNQKNDELGRDLSVMLRNLNQGIFTVGESGKVSAEHSDYLKTIFAKNDLSNQDAFELLFKDSGLSLDRIDQVKNATFASFGEDVLTFEMNKHLYPREIVIEGQERKRILEVDWQPLLNQDDTFAKMMVVLRDVTDFKALQDATEKNQKDLQIVAQVLSLSIRSYEKFSKNAVQLITENFMLIEHFKANGALELEHMFRNIHTIKGNARTFGLLYIAEIAHTVENYFSDLRTNREHLADADRLAHDLGELSAILRNYDAVISNFLGVDLSEAPEDLLMRLHDLYQIYSNPNEVKDNFFRIAEELHLKRFYPNLEEILSPVVKSQRQIAADLAKPKPVINFKGNDIFLNVEIETMLRNIFTQFLRNSIDHGIEDPESRLNKGKEATGNISIMIDTSVTHRDLIIEVQDDGAGINIAALAKKLDKSEWTDEQIAETIFQTGVSTAESVTYISGRGVGMDIVKNLVHKHGGTIEIVFTKPKSAMGRRTFKFVITLPSSYALSSEVRKLESVGGGRI